MPLLDESLLTGLPPFSLLRRPQVREILDLSTPRRHDERSDVFRQGAEADRFFLLLDGYIRVIRGTEDGEQVIALHIPPGQLFGIAPAIGKTSYPATAHCATEVLELSWPSRLWAEFVQKYQGFSTESYKTLGQRLGEFQAQVTDLATRAVEQRLAVCIRRMALQSGRKADHGIEIPFPITRADIAEMTGTTLHTVSRLMSAWEKDGIVRNARRQVTVTDLDRLTRLAGPAT